jgi:hypothetical protein
VFLLSFFLNKNDYVSLAALSPPLSALFLGFLMLLAREKRKNRKKVQDEETGAERGKTWVVCVRI